MLIDISDSRTCAELSCDECNERTDLLRSKIADLEAELKAARERERENIAVYIETNERGKCVSDSAAYALASNIRRFDRIREGK